MLIFEGLRRPEFVMIMDVPNDVALFYHSDKSVLGVDSVKLSIFLVRRDFIVRRKRVKYLRVGFRYLQNLLVGVSLCLFA